MANRIEVDVNTGQQTVVQTTPEEDAKAILDTAADQANQAQIAADMKDVNKAGKLLRAVCIYFGQVNGKTPAQVKAGIQAVYDSLP